MQNHLWTGSFCRCASNGRYYFPKRTVAVSDIITLLNDLGNRIPDKSWMLYLLEIFNSQSVACELNLICQFDGQNYFEAIFQGRNQHRFKEVKPLVGHSYQRQIIMNQANSLIGYILSDRTTDHTELFELPRDNNSHNKRFKFDFDGLNDAGSSDPNSILFQPYDALIPHSEGAAKQYPISFANSRIKEDDGCISYDILDGMCSGGLEYSQYA